MKAVVLPAYAVRFSPGELFFTRGTIDAFDNSGESCLDLLARHISGDWGDVCAEDKTLNESSVNRGERILSVYKLKSGVTVWVITNGDRSATTFLLPNEY